MRGSLLRRISWIVLAAVVGTTAWLTLTARREVGTRATARLHRQADRTVAGIETRMEECAVVLRGLDALFAASEEVTNDEWHAFLDHLEIAGSWTPFETVAVVDPNRAETVLFRTTFADDPGMLTPVVADIVSTLAAARAGGNDSRSVATHGPDGAGLIVLARPVADDARADTAAKDEPDRWFAVTIGIDRLIRKVVERRDPDIAIAVSLRVPADATGKLLSIPDSPPPPPTGPWPDLITTAVDLDSGILELGFSPLPGFEIRQESRRPWWIFGGGLAIGGLVFLLLRTFSRAHDRAIELAAEMSRGRSEALERYRAHLENTPLAAIEWDREHRVTSWNPTAERIFGHSEETIRGQPARRLEPEAEDGRLGLFLERVATEGAARETLVLAAHDGRRVVSEWYGTALADDHGRVVAAATLVDDVTESVELEERLRHAQKMDAVGRLAGGIAHDFNNILTAILGYADLLKMQVDSGSEPRRHVELIHSAAERAAELTQQLLAFSRRQVLKKRRISLATVVEGVEPMLRRLIGENISLVVNLPPDPWSTVADRGQLEQVVVNLVVNSRDAMPDGGRLVVDVRNVAGDSGTPDTVELSVADAGVGMDSETLAQAFDPFFTTKERGRGTGLGLATVYAVVESGGGRIDVDSSPGHGSTFRIRMPRAADDEGETDDDRPEVPEVSDLAVTGAEILLVEDDPAVLELTSDMLVTAGYRVVTAADAEEAIAALDGRSSPPDLLLTDVVLPGRTGVDLATDLRRRWPDLKVVFMSGYPDDALGPHGVLRPDVILVQKPFRSAELYDCLRRVLHSDHH